MAARAQERHALQTDLRHAIDGGELTLDFQPILDIASSQVIGAEALVRWLHPVRGRISPADFIPVAEESGLIVDLGAWVLHRACREAVSWANGARVAVNLSPLQFRDPDLLALIDTVLSETGLPPQRLELEITESVFLEAADKTIACLHALRLRGIHIALDDFGTGYSSLSYLRSFPFDKVKIDQSFIRDLSMNDDAIAIVQAIVGMASSLGMCTTGEGVETTAQAELLQSTGCSQVQGYLFGRPCSPEAIAAIMVAAAALPSQKHDPAGQVMVERERHKREMA
jgi:EAL domain-containing protein (putative c-di-GMP-specific phosphodiesterase class I)